VVGFISLNLIYGNNIVEAVLEFKTKKKFLMNYQEIKHQIQVFYIISKIEKAEILEESKSLLNKIS
jgi:hypothetical protein